MSGRLVGIARRDKRRAPMDVVDAVDVTVEAGLEGDHKGAKFPTRQVTILAIEDWQAALAALGGNGAGAPTLDWTCRRANLLVEGLRLPRAKGAIIAIGEMVRLEVSGQTVPCGRMDEVAPGLLKALYPDWRGGVTCRVSQGGRIAGGDDVAILSSPPERERRLPG